MLISKDFFIVIENDKYFKRDPLSSEMKTEVTLRTGISLTEMYTQGYIHKQHLNKRAVFYKTVYYNLFGNHVNKCLNKLI
jgi:hypothetical protein